MRINHTDSDECTLGPAGLGIHVTWTVRIACVTDQEEFSQQSGGRFETRREYECKQTNKKSKRNSSRGCSERMLSNVQLQPEWD